MPKLYVLMGKSATGKDTIYKGLLDHPQLSLKRIVLYTTRPVREGETEGIEYYFVKEDYLYQLQQEHKVIEVRSYDTIHGIWSYFTADDGQINLNEHSYIMIGTLESYSKLVEYFGPSNVMPIYIEVDDGIRLQRALQREREQLEPKYAELCRRFLADDHDFSEENIHLLGINKRYQNIDMEVCLNQIIDDIRNENI